MFPRPSLIAASALGLIFCLPMQGQDAPSLGDVARQAQKDKTNKTPAKVITNDDMPSDPGGPSFTLGAGPEQGVRSAPAASPAEQLDKLESILNQVDSLDSATLARNVLRGSGAGFPGREKWEERLFVAKQAYVTQGRALLQKARQIEATAESLKGVQDPNDPRVKNMSLKLQDFVREAVQVGSSFEAVMMEGRDLAAQASSH